MAGKLNLYQQDLKRFAEAAGTDLLPFMSPEERVRGLTLEERLRGFSPEEIRELDPQTLEKLKQILKNHDGKQT